MGGSLAQDDRDAALAALAAHYRAMPPVAAMQLSIGGFDGRQLWLQAPLGAHINDKACAFGGSLASLMTLAGWGLVTLQLQAAGLSADVFVADSAVRYRAPLFADLAAHARIEGDGDGSAFIAQLRERGRASAMVDAWVPLPDGGMAATATARFVAIARDDGGKG
jgi:thioesterase domain-containing protein